MTPRHAPIVAESFSCGASCVRQSAREAREPSDTVNHGPWIPHGVAHLIMSVNLGPRCRRSASPIAPDPQFSQLSDQGANSPGSP